jgi:hypothetical protein
MSWKQYAPDDPQGLRPFVEDYVDRLIKSGAFFVLDEEEGKRREEQVWDEMMKELKDHIENWPASRPRSDF